MSKLTDKTKLKKLLVVDSRYKLDRFTELGQGENAEIPLRTGVSFAKDGFSKSGGIYSSALSHSNFLKTSKTFVPPLSVETAST